jgi:hypothetical protein
MNSWQVIVVEGMHTCIGYQQVLGLMGTEHGVALEDLDCLASGVGDLNVHNMVVCMSDRDRERASCRSCASKKNDRKSLGEHIDKL